ncbi:hypothetical protein MMC25_001422 [Agyrium rufum]|nr:hypothetical protein [Agyrium rufum]
MRLCERIVEESWNALGAAAAGLRSSDAEEQRLDRAAEGHQQIGDGRLWEAVEGRVGALHALSKLLYFTKFQPTTYRWISRQDEYEYPEQLADKSFDNTGLLLEAPFDPIRRQMNSVLLTIDLTKAVADEAIERKDCVVVAYHPIIFRGLKSLTLANSQQQSLLRLALEGISVYCPHTAVDAVPGGMADWLADVVTGKLSEPEPETHTADASEYPDPDAAAAESSGEELPSVREELEDPFESMDTEQKESTPQPKRPQRMSLKRTYSRPTYPVPAAMDQTDLTPSKTKHARSTINPSPSPPTGFESAGMGRLVTFSSPQPLTHLIERIARGVGSPKGFPVAIPQGSSVESIKIRTVGICPGSGAAVLGKVQADLLFTGELPHHDALAAIERGSCVVTLFHSNTERGFLHSVMKARLERELEKQWKLVREEELQKLREGGQGGVEGLNEEWEDGLLDESILVDVSERDRDPFGVVILQDSEVQGQPITGAD